MLNPQARACERRGLSELARKTMSSKAIPKMPCSMSVRWTFWEASSHYAKMARLSRRIRFLSVHGDIEPGDEAYQQLATGSCLPEVVSHWRDCVDQDVPR